MAMSMGHGHGPWTWPLRGGEFRMRAAAKLKIAEYEVPQACNCQGSPPPKTKLPQLKDCSMRILIQMIEYLDLRMCTRCFSCRRGSHYKHKPKRLRSTHFCDASVKSRIKFHSLPFRYWVQGSPILSPISRILISAGKHICI